MTRDPDRKRLEDLLAALGIDRPEARLAENLEAYADILEAIRALRGLDLTDRHPAVVFRPSRDGGPEGAA